MTPPRLPSPHPFTPSPTRRAVLASGLAVAGLAASASRASQAIAQQTVADALVAAVNTSNTAGVADWVRTNVSTEGLARLDQDAWRSWLQGVTKESGRWSIDRIEPSGKSVRLYLRTERLTGIRRIDMRSDSREPGRILDLRPVLTPMPYPQVLSSAKSVTELADAARERFDYAVRSGDFSGAIRITDPSGRPVFEAVHGWADRAAGRPLLASTPINLGSADKSFTAVLIAQQVERGRLTFDTQVADILSDYAAAAFVPELTIRHLLSHVGGLGVPGGGILDYSRQRYSRVSDLLPAIAAVQPAFAPGTARAYSNEGFVVLGAVLERLGGVSYWELLEAGVYRPARMRHSAHLTREELKGRAALGYRHERNDLLLARPRVDNRDMAPWRGNSCGGGYSTAGDMARFFRALRNGHLISPTTLAAMTVPSGRPYPTLTYGLGFVLETVGATRLVGHSGGGGMSGIGASARVAIDSGWSIAVLSNYDVTFADPLLADLAAMLPA